ncbi:hypothetical protein [Psychrobacter sp. P2G3]|uniref:hypothetical protein n=1 Tax=Psychrobacter sp. P2G3 TaxID=1699622 RepID=UPI00082B79EE|nr:hypothetical protein [Psychrobacter sp. P2G3]
MSSYSFSHQFYQRWTRAPEQIRAAIVQELTDITTLLQTDTPFESFTFSLPDLDAHLDELYSVDEAEQAAAKELADKQAEQRAAAEQQRLAEEKKATEEKARAAAKVEREEAKRQEEKLQIDRAQKEQAQKQQAQKEERAAQLETDKNNRAKVAQDTNAAATTNDNPDTGTNVSVTDNEKNSADGSIHPNNHTEHTIVKPKKGAAIDLSFKDPELSAAHETLIHELEMHVDDYLSEQMMQMSEDLKSWLRAEVSHQLAGITEKNQAVEDIIQRNIAKKN